MEFKLTSLSEEADTLGCALSLPRGTTLGRWEGGSYQEPNLYDLVCELLPPRKCVSRSVMSNSATPMTVALQALLSTGFSRQEHWSGLLFPSPGDLPDPGIELGSPSLQADIYRLSHQGSSQGMRTKYCRSREAGGAKFKHIFIFILQDTTRIIFHLFTALI